VRRARKGGGKAEARFCAAPTEVGGGGGGGNTEEGVGPGTAHALKKIISEVLNGHRFTMTRGKGKGASKTLGGSNTRRGR